MAHYLTSPYRELAPYLPQKWSITNKTSTDLVEVPQYSSEFEEVRKYFQSTPKRILRHQNVNQYGMFLIRQQQLQTIHDEGTVKVPLFCSVSNDKLMIALQHNLDCRRLVENVQFTLTANIYNLTQSKPVLVVSFVTVESNRLNNLTPERDSDIYIEYIVYF